MQTKSLDIAGPAGRLEAVLMLPSDKPRASAVLCHAHPLHGGIMHFKLLFRVAKVLQKEGFAVLRFNFRGVGRSEGTHDEGRGEQDDVQAALDEIVRRVPDVPLLLGGFSFGSVMALRVGVREGRIGALLLMGFPVDIVSDTSFAREIAIPRLFVQGEQDRFGGADAIARFVEPLPGPKELVVVSGAGHFFEGKLEELEETVGRWIATAPWKS